MHGDVVERVVAGELQEGLLEASAWCARSSGPHRNLASLSSSGLLRIHQRLSVIQQVLISLVGSWRNLLYRLGQFSARRAWLVIAGWDVALGVAAGAFLSLGGRSPRASTSRAPGRPASRRSWRRNSPDPRGATGTVVFQSADGSALTERQQDDIAALLESVGKLDGVQSTVDPFATARRSG